MMDDELELIKSFIEFSINKNNYFDQHEPAPQIVGDRPTGGKLSFVITKSKSCSWAEDLHECRSQDERNRVYN